MALATNQVGFDVVCVDGERISIKTFAISARLIVNVGAFDHADHIMILQVALDENKHSI